MKKTRNGIWAINLQNHLLSDALFNGCHPNMSFPHKVVSNEKLNFLDAKRGSL